MLSDFLFLGKIDTILPEENDHSISNDSTEIADSTETELDANESQNPPQNDSILNEFSSDVKAMSIFDTVDGKNILPKSSNVGESDSLLREKSQKTGNLSMAFDHLDEGERKLNPRNLTAKIEENSRAAVNVKGGQITGGKITGGNIFGGEIVGGLISGGTIRGGVIKGGHMSNGFVDGGILQDGNMEGGFLHDGTVKGGLIRGGNITGGLISGGKILGGHVSSGMVEGGVLKNGGVEGGVLKGGIVDGGILKGGIMESGNLLGGIVWDGRVTGGTILGGEVLGGEIGEGVVIRGGRINGSIVAGNKTEHETRKPLLRLVLSKPTSLPNNNNQIKPIYQHEPEPLINLQSQNGHAKSFGSFSNSATTPKKVASPRPFIQPIISNRPSIASYENFNNNAALMVRKKKQREMRQFLLNRNWERMRQNYMTNKLYDYAGLISPYLGYGNSAALSSGTLHPESMLSSQGIGRPSYLAPRGMINQFVTQVANSVPAIQRSSTEKDVEG